ncbi:FecR family protein [Modicisalibacter sp. 'Wilcox']|uniref:FecR family protein n=1 Tax=Modicisalibacter sp. 'Wilcox' TaxID=2679914 RepID=UPI0013D86077|nr:FecR family protein [Modicisalibacter sp. 'Wilcox']
MKDAHYDIRHAVRTLPAAPALVAWLLWLAWLLAVPAFAAEPAGKVAFVTGKVSLFRDDAEHTPQTGDSVYPGDRFETAAGSHIHLRMVDGAFISLRSNSALRLDAYRYTPDYPSRSRAHVTLLHGVARSVTGEIGARDKAHFRFNTPVAAIGIRGTDFSVLTTQDDSRLSVRRGGVVMAPLSDSCDSAGLGPCQAGARDLYAKQKGALLEARRGERQAHITYEGVTPDEYAPPHPREDALVPLSYEQARASTSLARGESAPGVESYEEGLQQVDRYLASPGLATEAYALGEAVGPEWQPADRGLVAERAVTWGRWSDYRDGGSDTPSIAQLIYRNHQYAGLNSVFALLETVPDGPRAPTSGRAHFRLNAYEAYIKRGATLEGAAISHPGLVVDFDTQRFATRLDVHADSLPGPVHVVGGGDVSAGGLLRSDAESPSRLEGTLAREGKEAGLLFEYQVSPGVDAVGATHWVNEPE